VGWVIRGVLSGERLIRLLRNVIERERHVDVPDTPIDGLEPSNCHRPKPIALP
jgi:hypothetical protein